MKYFILTLSILVASLLNSSAAENYSCRDSKGRLHVADNLMSLPAECLHKSEISETNDSGKVNYVPPVQLDPQIKNDFNHAVNQQDQKVKLREREAGRLVSRAESLANSFENAVIKRKEALRNKQYGYRTTVVQAGQEMQHSRKEKEALLGELPKARLSSAQREQIEIQLKRIQN